MARVIDVSGGGRERERAQEGEEGADESCGSSGFSRTGGFSSRRRSAPRPIGGAAGDESGVDAGPDFCSDFFRDAGMQGGMFESNHVVCAGKTT